MKRRKSYFGKLGEFTSHLKTFGLLVRKHDDNSHKSSVLGVTLILRVPGMQQGLTK